MNAGTGSPQSPDLTDQAKSLASDVAQGASDKVLGVVEQQKGAAAEQVEDVARVLDGVAGEVERRAPVVAPYLRDAANQVHRISSSLRERGVDEILHDISDFARRRPAAVVGACLVGGFALARFLKSSADRQAGTRSRTSGSTAAMSRRDMDRNAFSQESSTRAPADRSEATLADVTRPGSGGGAPGTSAGGAEAPDQGSAGRI